MKLKVVAVDTWHSADLPNLNELMVDFRNKVEPPPGGVVIGFTHQQAGQGRPHLIGGIRMPLQRHILCREWYPPTEPERLELLLHELGHYLGAAHCPEYDSVMRPNLADRQALARKFRIGYDPLNTLAMNLVAQELRSRPIKDLSEMSPATAECLVQIYTELGKMLPNDPAVPKYLNALKSVGQR
jgi:hypothetical protein